jgi:hypothetical protein
MSARTARCRLSSSGIAAALLALGLAACGDDRGPLAIATPDRALFDAEVYPVLLRDCGFHACHGSTERFFQVFGPGRGRLLPTTMPLDAATAEEIAQTYARASSMIDPKAPDLSLLLRKPLAVEAGGTGHEGTDELGRNVYQSQMDLGYMVLARWVFTPAAPTVPPVTTPPGTMPSGTAPPSMMSP